MHFILAMLIINFVIAPESDRAHYRSLTHPINPDPSILHTQPPKTPLSLTYRRLPELMDLAMKTLLQTKSNIF